MRKSQLSQRMTKPTKRHVRPAKTQISLGFRPVWSESSLSAWQKLRSSATHWVHSEDSDQTRRMPSLIWVFAGHTCHFVGFVYILHRCVYTIAGYGKTLIHVSLCGITGWSGPLLSVYVLRYIFAWHATFKIHYNRFIARIVITRFCI